MATTITPTYTPEYLAAKPAAMLTMLAEITHGALEAARAEYDQVLASYQNNPKAWAEPMKAATRKFEQAKLDHQTVILANHDAA